MPKSVLGFFDIPNIFPFTQVRKYSIRQLQ